MGGEPLVERGELAHAELFGAEPGLGEGVNDVARHGGGEIVPERLAFLPETAGEEAAEGGQVGGERGIERSQPDDGAIDLWRRPEGGGFDEKQLFDAALRLHAGGEIAVIAAAGGGGKARGHFPLYQEDGALQQGAKREGPVDDGRGDVVRKVAADGGGPPLREVRREDISLDDADAGIRLIPQAERGGEGGVEFDENQFSGARTKGGREAAGAGTDFDDAGCALGARGFGDALEQVALEEKMLSETAAQAGGDQPFTSMALRRRFTRTQPAVGWPKVVAGSKWVNSRELSSCRRMAVVLNSCEPSGKA